jgi:hypothetical protein
VIRSFRPYRLNGLRWPQKTFDTDFGLFDHFCPVEVSVHDLDHPAHRRLLTDKRNADRVEQRSSERTILLASEPVPTSDFGEDQQQAFDLAGTIALPSPFPAFGRLAVVRVARPKRAASQKSAQGKKSEDNATYILKLVQAVSEKLLVTRFVSPGDVRSLRVVIGAENTSDTTCWELMDGADLRVELLKIDWGNTAKDERGSHEVELYSRAVLYVPESVQVLVRLEFGLPAALSVENALYTIPLGLTEQEGGDWSQDAASFHPRDETCRGAGGPRPSALQFRPHEQSCRGSWL